ncbi:MAG: pentapeptide repeat-containing protein [Ruminococcus sp.]
MVSETALSEAALSEAALSEAALSEATLSEAALSEAVESAVQSVRNTAIFTARLWVSENALTYSAVCSSEFHSTFSCEFR